MADLSNAERFLNAYARCEQALNRMQNSLEYKTFNVLLKECSEKNPVVRNHLEELKEYAQLRNAIVHQRDQYLEIIAEPTDAVTVRFEHLAQLLDQDLEVMRFASSPVLTAKPGDSVEEIFEKLNHLGADKLPVYSENNMFQGLVTMTEIAAWGLFDRNPEHRVEQLIKAKKSDRVVFLARHDSIMKAADVFASARREKNVTPVILITEHGKMNQKPVGILTSRDLQQWISYLS